MRIVRAFVVASMAAVAGLGAQTFRTSTDVVQIDVSVLDAGRRPVSGLTSGDFTVRVDGQPRRIVAFDAVDLPAPRLVSLAPWLTDVAPDVSTNDRPSGRLVVLVIDDGAFDQDAEETGGLYAVERTRAAAREAIAQLGPADLGAVLFTDHNRRPQNFTNDKARLLEAVNRTPIFPGRTRMRMGQGSETPANLEVVNDRLGILRGSCPCNLCSIDAVTDVARSLTSIPATRKLVIYISPGVVVAPDDPRAQPTGENVYESRAYTCNLRKHDAMGRLFRYAQTANVMIHAVDPKGLLTGGGLNTDSGWRLQFLRTMAETTGGRAVVNRNDVERDVPALFEETRSYYLLGVESGVANDDGKVHRITVTVNRPGVEVRAREGFYVPTAAERRTTAVRSDSGVADAIAGPLPSMDVPLEVSVTPLAEPGVDGRAVLAVVLGVTRPLTTANRSQERTERVDVLAAAFDPETGQGRGEQRQSLDVTLRPTGADGALFEVLSRLPIEPGRYQLRVGVKAADGTLGSVFTDVDVPDFGRDSLTVSGLMIGAMPSPVAAPRDAFRDLLPWLPTTRRAFAAADRVNAFLRVHGSGSAADRGPVPLVTTRITDASNSVVADGVTTLPADTWASRGFVDHELTLPVADLPAGEYLLTMDVTSGGTTVKRAVRFRVRP